MAILRKERVIIKIFKGSSLMVATIIFLMLILAGCQVSQPDESTVKKESGGEGQLAQPREIFLPDGDEVEVEAWAKNLEIPWSLVFLPDERALVSERPGRIRLIKEGKLQAESYLEIDVAHDGEGGLMGLAVHPKFSENRYLYAMYTYEKEGELFNRVTRLKDQGDKGKIDRIILDNIPGGGNHDGGRLAFGPDGMLYITTGDAGVPERSQNLKSLGGKILRLTPDGDIPDDNPFKNSPVYAYGNRNPQGITWHPETGALFESEHGPSGENGRFAHDEINIIKKGKNYGWPKVIGKAGKEAFIDPLVVWKGEAVPPGGITFYKGDLFVATLGSEALIKVELRRQGTIYRVTKIERWFVAEDGTSQYGRIRDVTVGSDGFLYFLTSNKDGRGNPRNGDDKIYRIKP